MNLRLSVLIPVLAFASCTSTRNDTLCTRFFEPYPDLITGRDPNGGNAAYLNAMALYSAADHAGAAKGLSDYLEWRAAHQGARLYLANCYLALGKPYEAELEIDKLEMSNLKGFEDQCSWYTVLCWLCSEQTDRALEGARKIASAPRHTYRKQAAELVKALE